MHEKLHNPTGHYRRYRNYDFQLSNEDQKKANEIIDELENLKVNFIENEEIITKKQKEIEFIFSCYRMAEKRERDKVEEARMAKYFTT